MKLFVLGQCCIVFPTYKRDIIGDILCALRPIISADCVISIGNNRGQQNVDYRCFCDVILPYVCV